MTSTAEVRPSTLIAPGPTETPRSAPHRLRDLDRSGWLVAGVIVVLIALPWIGSYWRAHDKGYTLSSDQALIALRVHDVLSVHPPFVGQPSTAAEYSGKSAPSHPGPIEYYLLAIPMNVFGPDAGSLIGAGIFTLGSVLVALWVVLRRAGPGVALAAAVVLAGIAWAEGPAVLTDILISNVGGIPLLGLAVLGWAVMDGDIRLLPLGAFFFSFVAQQHLAILALGLGGGLWVALGAARYGIRWRWDQRASRTGMHEEHWTRWRWSTWLARVVDVGDPPDERPKPWIVAGIVVTVLAWLPVFTEAVVHKGGNLWKIATFGGNSHAKLGLGKGITQALRALGFPPLLVRTNLHGNDMRASIGPLGALVGVAVIAALVAVAIHFWRSRTEVAMLALTTLFVAAVGAINGAQVPNSVESWRINFYRWMFVVSALTWFALGWAVVLLIAERRARSRTSASVMRHTARRRSWQLGAIGAVAIVSLLACFGSGPRVGTDVELQYRASRRINSVVRPSVARDHRVLVYGAGIAASLSLAPSLALKLTNTGHQVYIPSNEIVGYGKSRAVGNKPYDVAIWIYSSPKPLTSVPGQNLLSIDVDQARSHAVAVLARQARDNKLVVSPDAPQILRRVGRTSQGVALLRVVAAEIATKPRQALAIQAAAKLIQQGYFESPKFDSRSVNQLATTQQQATWGDRYITVSELTPAQVHERYPWIR